MFQEDSSAKINVINKVNLVKNGNFETVNLDQWTIRDINVNNGQITIGIDNQANAGNWGSFDDIELYIQE